MKKSFIVLFSFMCFCFSSFALEVPSFPEHKFKDVDLSKYKHIVKVSQAWGDGWSHYYLGSDDLPYLESDGSYGWNPEAYIYFIGNGKDYVAHTAHGYRGRYFSISSTNYNFYTNSTEVFNLLTKSDLTFEGSYSPPLPVPSVEQLPAYVLKQVGEVIPVGIGLICLMFLPTLVTKLRVFL